MDRMPVAASPLAQLCGIELAAAGAIDDAQLKRTLPRQGHGDAAVRNPAGIVGRAVNGIDDPDVFLLQVPEVLLFAEEAAARQQRGQPLRQEMLHGEVGGGHEVGKAVLLHDGEMVGDHQRGGLPDDIDDLLEHGVRIFRPRRYIENSYLCDCYV